MATTNQIGVGLKGSTGSGTFVGSDSPILTSPTLVTPTLGVASATSVNFGGSTLSAYVLGTFTPTFTFDTPGDVSVAYTTQTGIYAIIGGLVFVFINLNCTPTFTTSSGSIRIAGLPYSSLNSIQALTINNISAGYTWPGTATQVAGTLTAADTYVKINALKSATATNSLSTTSIVSGGGLVISMSGCYRTS